MIPTLVNSLWRVASLRHARRFRRAAGRVAETQHDLLAACLAANRDTEYGRRHGFATLRSATEFQQRVPLTVYDDYAGEIERLAAGESGLLTRQPVLRFEPSSGSTAASKLIPYTAALRAEFGRGLAVWIADLYRHDPRLLHGPAYWSITPLTEGAATTSGGLPIGFEEDSGYLGPLGALVESIMAVPNAVKHLRDVATFRYATLLFLLRERELRLISVWNPTFLTLLLAPLAEWWEQLLDDLAHGTFHPPGQVESSARRGLERHLKPATRRARELARQRPGDLLEHWPHLCLLSCWADGPSAPYAKELAHQFPEVMFQAKGLLATEAFVSLPLVGHEGAALAVMAHFFEFLDDSGEPQLAHQLTRGHTYAVVVTTGGGFYRYQLHDIVEVVGFIGQIPCLRFVGKTDQISDWFGEKLHESFVSGVLEELFDLHGLRPSFALVAPEKLVDGRLRYALYLELAGAEAPAGLDRDLDAALSQNFHYAYCRRLGQLAEPRVAQIEHGQERYLAACQSQGQKLGNVKPAALQKGLRWGEWLGGR